VLPATDLAAFITGLGITTPIVAGPWVPDNLADRLIVLTVTGGPGSSLERLFDTHSFQARCRGTQRNPADAETLAAQVDDALLNVVLPTRVGGRHVPRIDRAGSPPNAFARDSAGRDSFVCSYLLTIAR